MNLILLISLIACASSTLSDLEISPDDDYFRILDEVEKSFLEVAKAPEKRWPPKPPKELNEEAFEFEVLAKAPFDSCYCEMSDTSYKKPCNQTQLNDGCSLKTSQSYAWGMARTDKYTYWGTVANIPCLFANTTFHTEELACTGFENEWMVPELYRYDNNNHTLDNLNDQIDGSHEEKLNDTLGIRACGYKNDVIVFAGPSKSLEKVHMFAFNAETGSFLDSITFLGANDVRKFTKSPSNEDMYVGISHKDNTGDILRYLGSVSEPLNFELVSRIEGVPAELSFYYDRLLVGTWPASGNITITSQYSKPCKLLLSARPIAEFDGKSVKNQTELGYFKNDWTKIWSITDYEPDPLVAYSYSTSVAIQIGEYVYWGTLQLPYSGVALFSKVYGTPKNRFQQILYALGTHRPCSLFRGRYLNSSSPEIELLYGELFFPAYDPLSKVWSFKLNQHRPSRVPTLGRSGFGNFYNMYIWSMVAEDDKLYIGTFDVYNITNLFPQLPNFVFPKFAGFAPIERGGDIFVLDISEKVESLQPAKYLTLNGLGNPYNYGFRNMVISPKPIREASTSIEVRPDSSFDQCDGTCAKNTTNLKYNIMIGTANPYNTSPRGGWELIELDVA